MATEGEMQEKYMQFKMLQEHIEKISEQLQQISGHLEEIDVSKEALTELESAPLKKEMMCPVANGIFVKAALNDNKHLLVNVGADTAVEKTFAQVMEMLEAQRKELHAKLKEGEALLQQMHLQAMEIYQQVEDAE